MYLFVIGRPVGDQAILDVYAADGSRLIASCLTLESTLPRPALRTTVDFPRIDPATLRAWFHPANPHGVEFVYSQAEAKSLFGETGLPVPYAAFKASNRDLVGAFPVRRVTPLPVVGVASAAAIAPAAAGTTGITAVFEPFDDSLSPHEHLTSARRLLAARAIEASPERKRLFETIERQVSQLQASYRKKNNQAVASWVRVIHNSIDNLLPPDEVLRARRQERLPRRSVLMLERVRAHVAAFARTTGLPTSSRR